MHHTLSEQLIAIFTSIVHVTFIFPLNPAITYFDDRTIVVIILSEFISLVRISYINHLETNYCILGCFGSSLLYWRLGYLLYCKYSGRINHDPPLLLCSWLASPIFFNWLAKYLEITRYPFLLIDSILHVSVMISAYILLSKYLYPRTH